MSDAELRAWDWQVAMREQDRSRAWLARRTDRSDQTLRRWIAGEHQPPIEWLRQAARILGLNA